MRFPSVATLLAAVWAAPTPAQVPAPGPSRVGLSGVGRSVPASPVREDVVREETVQEALREEATSPAEDDGRGTPYVVDKTDNICGIDEPRAITNPAKVDYQALLDETPEVKEIKRRKIDPDSAKGIELMTKARRRVLAACEKVRSAKSHCSIWKKIKRRDKQDVSDVTDEVKKEIQASDGPSISSGRL